MPRTAEPLQKLASGRWQIRYRDADGVQRKRTFRTATEARAELAAIRTAVRAGAYIDPRAGRQTFGSFADEWAAAQDWKATTRQSWSSILRRLEPLSRVPLQGIDELRLQRLQTSLLDVYDHDTVLLTIGRARSIMKAAHRSGRIGRDVTAGLRPPRRRAGDERSVGPDEVPTRDEVIAVLEAAPPPFRAAVALGIAGLRVGEVLGVTADRFESDTRSLLIDRQLQHLGNENVLVTPKNEKVRKIVVPQVVGLELRRHLRDHQGAGLLFRGARATADCTGMRRDQFYVSAWRPALEGAGFEPRRFKFHSLRHYCASAMLAEGVNPIAVAGYIGDTLETLQRVYAHWMRDDHDVPALALDRILDAGTSSDAEPFVPSMRPVPR